MFLTNLLYVCFYNCPLLLYLVFYCTLYLSMFYYCIAKGNTSLMLQKTYVKKSLFSSVQLMLLYII